MNLYSRGIYILLFVLLLMSPMPASAVVYPMSFGGHVIMIVPCIHGALWVAISSARTLVPTLETYIWTPRTITFLAGPPNIVDQGLLGLADGPFSCVTPAAVTLFGLHMLLVGSGIGPQS
jgi:hypothetical protein